MTKSTITRERLEQLADNNTICKVSWDERIELAQIALAAMDSEPVAWIVHARTGDQLTTDGNYVANAEGILGLHSTPLYRHVQPAQTGVDDDVRNIIGLLETNEWAEHCTETVLGSRLEAEITRLVGSAQTAPVVPDKMNYQDGVLFVLNNDMSSIERGTVAMRAWNACRAAMLQADNSPVIPNTWIPVSERMPEKGQAVLVYRPKAHEGGDSDVRVAVYGRHNFEHGFGCYWEPSHWMPLPAAPQEVK